MVVWRWGLGHLWTVNLTFTHSGSDDDYEEDSSEEGGEGPFNMVTETYIPEEDYEDYDL